MLNTVCLTLAEAPQAFVPQIGGDILVNKKFKYSISTFFNSILCIRILLTLEDWCSRAADIYNRLCCVIKKILNFKISRLTDYNALISKRTYLQREIIWFSFKKIFRILILFTFSVAFLDLFYELKMCLLENSITTKHFFVKFLMWS